MATATDSTTDDTEPLHDLTGFQRDLLREIGRNPGACGLTIKDDLEQVYGTEIRHGRLYPNLDTLVDRGLIEKGEQDKRTNAYTISRAGRERLTEHIKWFTEGQE